MKARPTRTTREPTIALINIVFLMLVFFMVAGTLAPPLDGELKLVATRDLEGRAPPDVLVIHADGRLSYRGAPVAAPADYLALAEAEATSGEYGPTLRIVPDRDLDASDLVRIAGALRAAGAGRVLVVTERGLD
ncbi:ExbD/TolR family protein [Citreimonas salinaria]|uniref:Biopolymer transport protein ExbD n=1 Tax=Citreimonas salinaria TaxID=321339 RepID=A0A1H3MV30_9RHOB|nr:biopolymer transporter ExbD [Citreimonas salinaria]SDY79869.1 biopolymer transport protein ExbD [Citreimonas salinaria]